MAGNVGQTNRLYLNDGGGGFSVTGLAVGSETDVTYSVVLWDVDRDGDPDLVAGISGQANKLYRNGAYLTGSQTVVSLPVNDGVTVSSVGLLATDTVNTAATRNTAIDYFLSSDGGAHWYRVYPGNGVVFPGPATDLR